MNCKIFEQFLGDFIEGDLSPQNHEQCADHLTHCAECDTLKAEYELTIKLAAEIKEHEITADIRKRLRDRLEVTTGIRFAMNE
jgi:hypothetical protein